ncbi:hypothetical protein, conserved [Eimeria brunetti]|uniref:Uncharacterized protein n=1 Tax=Eimeria brunetti TaxID=51314 RepID=U6LF27_9EIME|nr:hypothetical protein, conserved [Eimeria brunetti]
MGDITSKNGADFALHQHAAAEQQPPRDGEQLAAIDGTEVVPEGPQALRTPSFACAESAEARCAGISRIEDAHTGVPATLRPSLTGPLAAVEERLGAANVRQEDLRSIPTEEQNLEGRQQQQGYPSHSSTMSLRQDTMEQGPAAPYPHQTNLAGELGNADDRQEVQGSNPWEEFPENNLRNSSRGPLEGSAESLFESMVANWLQPVEQATAAA